MDAPNNSWTGLEKTEDQDEEVLLDPPITDEEMQLDPPVHMEEETEWQPPVEQETEWQPPVEEETEWQPPVKQEVHAPRSFRPQEAAPRSYEEPEEARSAPAESWSAAVVDAWKKRPKESAANPWKWVSIALVGVVLIALVFGMVNRTGNRQAPNPTTQSTPIAPNTSATRPGTPYAATGALLLLNPSIVRQGTSMGVTGTGFDPGSTVDLAVSQQSAGPGQAVSYVRADRSGFFISVFAVPVTMNAGPFFVEAHERGSTKMAQARGTLSGGTPQLKLAPQVGKPGDVVTASLHGFSPSEPIKVYWNTISGQPVETLQADTGGGIGQAKVQVPFGAAGVNTFLFVGAKSQSLVASSFQLLSLYPTARPSSYAIRAGNQLSFSGAGFGPGERVVVFLNSTASPPVSIIQTSQYGTFNHSGSFSIPFGLKGRQEFIFEGQESGASVAVGWTVEPYMPSAQASTYGGLPGTTVTFYVSGFASDEVVHVYTGHTANNPGNMVSCFRADGRGNAVSAGSYVIPGNAQGKLVFTMTGSKSGGVATATMSVMAPPFPVQVPAQPQFNCPLDSAAPAPAPNQAQPQAPNQALPPNQAQPQAPNQAPNQAVPQAPNQALPQVPNQAQPQPPDQAQPPDQQQQQQPQPPDQQQQQPPDQQQQQQQPPDQQQQNP
jgi:hypothetical protein